MRQGPKTEVYGTSSEVLGQSSRKGSKPKNGAKTKALNENGRQATETGGGTVAVAGTMDICGPFPGLTHLAEEFDKLHRSPANIAMAAKDNDGNKIVFTDFNSMSQGHTRAFEAENVTTRSP